MKYIDYKKKQRELSHMIAVFFHKNNIEREWASKMLTEILQEYQVKHK